MLKEFLLDEPPDEKFLEFLGKFGTVRTLKNMKMPYFSFERQDFISIKGFIGDHEIEVRYRKEFQDLTGDYFHLILFYQREEPDGIEKLLAITQTIQKKIDLRKSAG